MRELRERGSHETVFTMPNRELLLEGLPATALEEPQVRLQ